MNIDEKTTSKPDSEIVSKSQSDDTKINEVIDKDSLDTDSKKDSIEVVTNVKKDSIEVVTIDDDVVDKKTKQKKKNIVGKKSSKPNEATHKGKDTVIKIEIFKISKKFIMLTFIIYQANRCTTI